MRKDSRRPKIYAFIRDRIEQIGEAPTCREAGDAVGISAVAAWKHYQALIRDGKLVKREDGSIDLPNRIDLSSVGTEQLRAELARRGVTLDALETPRSFGRARYCAAHGCQQQVRPGMLMCRRHWFQLPRPMRSAIVESWSARQMQPYQEAVEAARDHLGGFTRVVERVE